MTPFPHCRSMAKQLAHVGVDETGEGLAFAEGGMRNRVAEKADIRCDPLDPEIVKCTRHAVERAVTFPASDDHLCDHRIVVETDGVALAETAVDANAIARGWRFKLGQLAGRR